MLHTTDSLVLKGTADAVLIEAREIDSAPGVANDVFYWFEDGTRKIAKIPWINLTDRRVALTRRDLAIVNAEPLPNGIPVGNAILAGVILRDATGDWRFNAPLSY